jgi:ATP-dependent RNA helicase RhlE
MPFQQLNIIEPILKALKHEGYSKPTPIQEQAIPIVLKRRDLLGCAQTGTGKTAAFAIPIIQLLVTDEAQQKFHGEHRGHTHPKPILSLILTPTRELAVQIGESFAAYGRHCNLKHLVIFGGVSQHSQVESLKRGVDILIATPGRLLDLMNQRFVNLSQIKIFVLDEADRMLDMGFINDVQKVITKIPAKRQTLFFSATMPPVISKLADSILHEPVRVEVTPPSSTVDKIKQELYYVTKNDKRNLLIHLLKDESIKRILVFTRTKHGADKVMRDLVKINIKSAAIHGNKSQNARQNALNNFKSGEIRVLVATDIAARGIDVDSLSHVLNYELPNVPETYVHRIGRTGRAGLNGVAISFCDAEERAYLKDIQKEIGKQIPVVTEHPYPMSADTPYVPPVDNKNKRSGSHSKQHHYGKPGNKTGGGNSGGPKRWQNKSSKPQQ